MTDEVVESFELPHRMQIDPIVGYKAMRLSFTNQRIKVGGQFRTYDSVDETAKCHAYPKPDPEHMAPDINCKCGMYGYLERSSVSTYDQALATVEAFGYIVMHEKGYRASRQRIVSLEMSTECEMCKLMNDPRRSSDALYVPSGNMHDVHLLCSEHGEQSIRLNAAMRITLDEVQNQLGIPVTWK